MEEDWENIASTKLPTAAPTAPLNKWAGEDEDDDVKESWEDEEEKKDTEKNDIPNEPVKIKPKKSLADKIAEKERNEGKEQNDDEEPELTAEEKLRRRQLQEEKDLKLALETLGVGSNIDDIEPEDKAGFDELSKAINRKLSIYKSREEFPGFVEDLLRKVCVNLNSFDLKKLKSSVDNLYLEKLKIEKGDKAKKAKGKGKAKLKLEGENAHITQYNDYEFDDYDDFM